MPDLKTIRTDVVGSLLRPDSVKQARRRFDEGAMAAEELRAIEDEAVRRSVRMQEDVGIAVVTDGEVRRLNFQDSFGAAVTGYDAERSTMKANDQRVEGSSALQRWEIPDLHHTGTAVAHRRPAKERLRLARNVPLEEYEFLKTVASGPAKVTLIGADRVIQRFDYANSRAVYPTVDDFVADVVAIEREMVKSLVAAGSRYIHIDAPGFTAYVDEPSLEQMRARGEDPNENFSRALKAEAAIVDNLGPDVARGIHLCRGNQRSMWHREGKYDAIAERLFNELPHDRFLLEYDSERAGSFEPLRLVPKGKVVVLGLVSTKVAEIENVDDLARRVDQASRFLPLEQLAISPQCGFASDVVGNLIGEDEQRRKLEVVVAAARKVWGTAQ